MNDKAKTAMGCLLLPIMWAFALSISGVMMWLSLWLGYVIISFFRGG